MVRQSVSIQIPQEYEDNEKNGLCRVCGKPREEFEKGRTKHCSEKCASKYQECFLYWNTFRDKIIKESSGCVKCGSKINLEADHIIPVAITDFVFDESNIQVLCKKCHAKKTKKDLLKIKNHRNKQQELRN